MQSCRARAIFEACHEDAMCYLEHGIWVCEGIIMRQYTSCNKSWRGPRGLRYVMSGNCYKLSSQLKLEEFNSLPRPSYRPRRRPYECVWLLRL